MTIPRGPEDVTSRWLSEVLGREVVLYWRSLAPREKVELSLSLLAAVPGTYTAPASRAYLYYTPEKKHWAKPLQVQITRPASDQDSPPGLELTH